MAEKHKKVSGYGVTGKNISRTKGIHQDKNNEKIFGGSKKKEGKPTLKLRKKNIGIPSEQVEKTTKIREISDDIENKDDESGVDSVESPVNSTSDSVSPVGDLVGTTPESNTETDKSESGRGAETVPDTSGTESSIDRPDGRGKHLTSDKAKEIRTMRRFYGRHVPPLQCNVCSYTSVCPMYKAGYACAFEKVLDHKITNPADINNMMLKLAETDMRRAQLGLIFENLSGGAIDGKVSDRIDAAFMKLQMLKQQMIKPDGGDELHVKGSIVKDLLAKALGNQPESKEVVADVVATETEFVEKEDSNGEEKSDSDSGV